MTPDEVNALAVEHYPDETSDSIERGVFSLLVDVADAYLTLLENEASDDPAPFLGGTTPLECLFRGLLENLEIRRGDMTGGTLPPTP